MSVISRLFAALLLFLLPSLALAQSVTWSAGTTSGTTQNFCANAGACPPSIAVQLDQGSGISAGAITFQVSYDGSNWVAMAASQVIDPTSPLSTEISIPYTLVASTNKPFLLLTRGVQGVRAEVSTTTEGGSVTVYWAPNTNSGVRELNAANPLNVNSTPVIGSGISPVGGAGVSQETIKASSGQLIDGYVTASSAGYIFVFNSASSVSNGSVTFGLSSGDYQDCEYLPAAGTLGLTSYGLPTEPFSAGIVIAFSSTGCSTLTLADALLIKGRAQ